MNKTILFSSNAFTFAILLVIIASVGIIYPTSLILTAGLSLLFLLMMIRDYQDINKFSPLKIHYSFAEVLELGTSSHLEVAVTSPTAIRAKRLILQLPEFKLLQADKSEFEIKLK